MRYTFVLFTLLISMLCISCQTDSNLTYQNLNGEIFGTYYRFQIDSDLDFSTEIDSIFKVINIAANTYEDTSEISQFNREGILKVPSPTFMEMIQQAQKYHLLSDGYFEPTLYPLTNAWGFGIKNREKMDSAKVDSLLSLVSLTDNLSFDSISIKAIKKGVMIDLSALGEGFAIDAITSMLDKNGVMNYMVEIGGEMKCKGKNVSGQVWKVGIENPENLSELSLMYIIPLNDIALSSSGNYRNFFTDSIGNRFAHIISPKTGYPITLSLLSASIVSRSSTAADALATACMAMGTEKAKRFIEKNPEIEGFLIFSEGDKVQTWKSTNFPKTSIK